MESESTPSRVINIQTKIQNKNKRIFYLTAFTFFLSKYLTLNIRREPKKKLASVVNFFSSVYFI